MSAWAGGSSRSTPARGCCARPSPAAGSPSRSLSARSWLALRARWRRWVATSAVGGASVLLDCAHNLEGVGTLCAYMSDELHVDPQRTSLVFGAIDEKPFSGMLDALAPLATRRHYCRPIDPTAGR